MDSSQFNFENRAKVLGNQETVSAGIEVLLFDLASSGWTQSGDQLFVSPEEIGRAGRYKFDRLGQLFLLRRHILRSLLANRLDRHPKDILFEENPYGRPQLVDGSFHFNTSHSGPYYVVALSGQVQPGVDIEVRQEGKSYVDLVHLVLSEPEIRECDRSDASSFLQYWTCKEALLKAYGSGLQEDMREIVIELGDARVTIRSVSPDMGSPGDWRVTLLDSGIPGLHCACAWRNTVESSS